MRIDVRRAARGGRRDDPEPAEVAPVAPLPVAVRPGSRALRWAVVGAWVTVLTLLLAVRGVPLDRVQVLLLIVATLAVVTLVTGGRLARLLRDWLPLTGLLLAYDLTRGAADTLGMPVQVGSVAAVEEALFAGHVPTVWLQGHVYPASWEVAWWEAPIALVYASHFIVPYAVGAWHWTRGREAWWFWLRRFVGVTAVGLAVFCLLPAAPPWYAAEAGVIGPVKRQAARGWEVLGLDIAGWLVDTGQASVNQVAALPSLHAAHAALVPALLWRGRSPLARLGLLAYPLAMGFVLVLTGEHYVVDVLAGFALVVGVCGVAGRWERRRARPSPPDATDPPPGPAEPTDPTGPTARP